MERLSGSSFVLYFKEMSKFEEPDILFNMLNCLKILCLHGECLYLASKDHPQFLAYVQEKMLIPRCGWFVITRRTDKEFAVNLV